MTADLHPHQPVAAAAEATPVPISGKVDILGAVVTHSGAADFGAPFTLTFAGTEQPLGLLPYDPHRARAFVTCTGTGPVYLSYRDPSGLVTVRANGLMNGQAPVYVLATGITLQILHKQAVFIAPDGTHTATVSVSVERWDA